MLKISLEKFDFKAGDPVIIKDEWEASFGSVMSIFTSNGGGTWMQFRDLENGDSAVVLVGDYDMKYTITRAEWLRTGARDMQIALDSQ